MPGDRAALILTGGGARVAYQVGVLRAVAEMLPPKAPSPFRIVCGTSAGAINAAAVAAASDDFPLAVADLEAIWSRLVVSDIYRADVLYFTQRFGRWLLSLVPFANRNASQAMLDNSPLAALLRREIDFPAIRRRISEGSLDALAITASSYRTGTSVSFCAAADGVPLWKRSQRVGIGVEIGPPHLLASSAIPFVFAPVRIGDEYFGDGAMRQLTPTAPALHLGAERILVIGAAWSSGDATRARPDAWPKGRIRAPSAAHIGSHALASIFADALGTDLEKVELVNAAVRLIPPEHLASSPMPLRQVDLLVITPSRPLEALALEHLQSLPPTLRMVLRRIGGTRAEGAGLLSYLLFEGAYCKALIALGYRDAQERKAELARHLALS
jgi:NTE family protein